MAVFVGRTRELERLNRVLETTRAGRGRVVFITGEAGAGKSAVVAQFMVDAALRSAETRIIGATCSEQYGAGEPYQPFIEAFRDLISGREESGTSRWSALREMASELAPAWIGAIPVAGNIISATIATAAELKKLGGGVATAAPSEEALFFQYTELFLAAAAQSPIILFIDDLHWADAASVALLTHLARRIVDQRVLILGTYRPVDVDVGRHPVREARLELERYGLAEEIGLEALDPGSLTELVEAELDGPAAPELVAWLTRIAGSNPLYFAELLRWAVEHGIAREQSGEWVLPQVPDAIDVPRSAESMIERRLGRLEPEVYKVLEYASVEGNEFGSTTLSRLLGMDELALEEAVEPLVRLHRLVRLVDTRELPSGDLSSIYQFSHSLIQDVLHRNLHGKRRILLHRKMAEILEALHAGSTDGVAHRLAIHFDEGRLAARAFEFALRGADRATQVYAHRDAIALIRLALRNAQDDAQRLEAQQRLGEESWKSGHLAEALAAFRAALALAESAGDAHTTLALRRKLVLVERESGGLSPAELQTRLEALTPEADALGDLTQLCQILWQLNDLPTSRLDDRVARGERALGIAQSIGTPALLAAARLGVAKPLVLGSDPRAAVPHLREAFSLYMEMEDRAHIGLTHNMLAIVHALSGEYVDASREFDLAATAFDRAGDPVNEASIRNNLGILLTRIGDWAGAERNLRESLRLTRRLNVAARILHPLENVARLHQARGNLKAARDHWRELLELARRTGYWSAEVMARCGLAEIALSESDMAEAYVQRQAAEQLLENREAWHEGRTDFTLLSARIAATAEETDRAIEMLRAAEDALASRDRYLFASVRLERAALLARRDPAAAIPLLEEILDTARELRTVPMAERAGSILSMIRGAA